MSDFVMVLLAFCAGFLACLGSLVVVVSARLREPHLGDGTDAWRRVRKAGGGR